MDFMRLFVHGRLYLLPDDTQVRALLYNMEGLLLEWIFEDLGGVRKIGVLPNGQIIGYIPRAATNLAASTRRDRPICRSTICGRPMSMSLD